MRLAKSVVTWMVNARSSIDEMRAPAISYINCVEQSTLSATHEIGGPQTRKAKAKIPIAMEKPSLGFSSSSPGRALDWCHAWRKTCGMDLGKACGMDSGTACGTCSGKPRGMYSIKGCGTGSGEACGMDSGKACGMVDSPVSDGGRLGVVLEVVGSNVLFFDLASRIRRIQGYSSNLESRTSIRRIRGYSSDSRMVGSLAPHLSLCENCRKSWKQRNARNNKAVGKRERQCLKGHLPTSWINTI